LHLKIDGFSWGFPFLVVQHLDCELILGFDFINNTGLVIDSSREEFYCQFAPDSVFKLAPLRPSNFSLYAVEEEKSEVDRKMGLDRLQPEQRARLRTLLGKYPQVLTAKLRFTHLME
jgi:hypothetical protein